jgi:hypothetical protein
MLTGRAPAETVLNEERMFDNILPQWKEGGPHRLLAREVLIGR